MTEERLQKIIARAGIASRRAAEEMIEKGRVRVDGRIVKELGAKADPRKSRIEVDGTRIVAEDPVYVVLHKPRAVVSTVSDPEGRRTVLDCVNDLTERVVPIGRLDYHTSGVLLLTNDGEFAHALMHPRKSAPKVYIAKFGRALGTAELEALGKSIVIDGRPTRPAKVEVDRVEEGKTWVQFTLKEGRNRQIHRLAEAQNLTVMRLARVEFAGLNIDGLRPGQWRELTSDELTKLRENYGQPKKIPKNTPKNPRIQGKEVMRHAPAPPARRGPGGAKPRGRSADPKRPSRPGRPAGPAGPAGQTRQGGAPGREREREGDPRSFSRGRPDAPARPGASPRAGQKSATKPSAPLKATQRVRPKSSRRR